MLKTLLVLIFSVTILSMSGYSIAYDSTGSWKVLGAGGATCEHYLKAEGTTRRCFEFWIDGYISGINHSKPGRADFTAGASLDFITFWMENYCKKNPQTEISDVVDILLKETSKKQPAVKRD